MRMRYLVSYLNGRGVATPASFIWKLFLRGGGPIKRVAPYKLAWAELEFEMSSPFFT